MATHATLGSLHRAFAFVACLVPAASAWGVGDGSADVPVAPSAADKAGIATARVLIRQSRFTEALDVLRPLARGRESTGTGQLLATMGCA